MRFLSSERGVLAELKAIGVAPRASGFNAAIDGLREADLAEIKRDSAARLQISAREP